MTPGSVARGGMATPPEKLGDFTTTGRVLWIAPLAVAIGLAKRVSSQ